MLTGLTILLVEDNDIVRRTLVVLFEAAGAEVVEAGTLAQARSILGARVPHVAFLDVDLPEVLAPSGSRTTFIGSFGAVTLVHELRDSMTGTVLLRYMGRRRAPGGSAVGFVAPWSGLKRTFDRMLSDLQQSLVETVPLSTATKGPLARCNGLIYKRIEES